MLASVDGVEIKKRRYGFGTQEQIDGYSFTGYWVDDVAVNDSNESYPNKFLIGKEYATWD